MSKVERGVIKAPNTSLNGLAQTRSTTPDAGRPTAPQPNVLPRGVPVGGSGPLTRSASPVSRPDHRFNVENAKMPQPPSAVEPGTGAVPIYGFSPMGVPNRALPETDSAH